MYCSDGWTYTGEVQRAIQLTHNSTLASSISRLEIGAIVQQLLWNNIRQYWKQKKKVENVIVYLIIFFTGQSHDLHVSAGTSMYAHRYCNIVNPD